MNWRKRYETNSNKPVGLISSDGGLRSASLLATVLATLLATVLGGCSSSSVKVMSNYVVELPAILNQVNDSIQAAKSINGGQVPEITSIELDLQVESETSTSVGVPLFFVTPEIDSDEDHAHQIQVIFVPKANVSEGTIEKAKSSELTNLIAGIDLAVAKANPLYDFQKGSIKIQCTFTRDGGVSAGTDSSQSSGGSTGNSGSVSDANSGGVRLVPIKIGVKHSKKTIQSITLNFAPNLNPTVAEKAPGPSRKPARAIKF